MVDFNFPFQNLSNQYIQAAPDIKLSSLQSNLLSTLLNEEDQHDYTQLLTKQLPSYIYQILYQVIYFFNPYVTHLFFYSI